VAVLYYGAPLLFITFLAIDSRLKQTKTEIAAETGTVSVDITTLTMTCPDVYALDLRWSDDKKNTNRSSYGVVI